MSARNDILGTAVDALDVLGPMIGARWSPASDVARILAAGGRAALALLQRQPDISTPDLVAAIERVKRIDTSEEDSALDEEISAKPTRPA